MQHGWRHDKGDEDVNRRDFSKWIAVGAAGLGGGLRLGGAMAGPVGAGTAGGAGAGGAAAPVSREGRREWAKAHFRGFENVLVASFTPDLKALDEDGIRLDVRQSIAHGFFSTLCAPAGLTHEDMLRFVEIAVDEAAGRIAVGAALHAPTEALMRELLAHCERVGCQHVLLDLPREGSAEELVAYGLKYARATNLGIYLWMATVHNFQRFHPSGIPYQVFDRLAEEPNIIALKVGSMDPAVVFELFERYNERMLIGSMWPAIMPFAIESYGQQWSGAWSVEAVQSPETPYATDFFNLMMAHRYQKGMKLYWEHVAPGFGAMMKMMGKYMATGAHPWELIKYYQFCVGGNGGPMRVDPEFPDIPPVGAEDMAFVRESYRRIGVPVTDLPDAAFRVGRVNWEKGVR